jgi:hypothetical protein
LWAASFKKKPGAGAGTKKSFPFKLFDGKDFFDFAIRRRPISAPSETIAGGYFT